MERLTKYITPVGTCMTTLNSMKHYMPCVPCRKKAPLKTRANGEMYTEKHSYCDTCEVKMLFNRLKEYEDAEEQGLLIRLPCKVGDVVYTNMRASGWYKREKNKPYKANVAFIGINGKDNFMNVVFENDNVLQFLLSDIGKTVFLTKEEAEAALAEMEK